MEKGEEKTPHMFKWSKILQDTQQLRGGAGKNACRESSLASLEALKSFEGQSLLTAGQSLCRPSVINLSGPELGVSY